MSNDLKYHQQILQKVSFDTSLFTKELKKAYRCLEPKERNLLFNWLQVYIAGRAELAAVVFDLST